MNKETFLQKMHSILKKTGNNCYVVSDDPDCECDFGVDEKNHLIICKAPTFLPVYELEDITYYDDKEMNIEDAYIHFTFKYQTELFLYYNDDDTVLGDIIHLAIKGCDIRGEVAQNILYTYYDWDYSHEDFLIDDGDGTLIVYIGTDKKVEIPDGVVNIGSYAFDGARTVEEVVLPDSLTKIDEWAFIGGNNLQHIDLNNVEIIGNNAFQARSIESITIPKTVKEIGKEAFFYCSPELLENITNNSSVVIDESIIKVRDW